MPINHRQIEKEFIINFMKNAISIPTIIRFQTFQRNLTFPEFTSSFLDGNVSQEEVSILVLRKQRYWRDKSRPYYIMNSGADKPVLLIERHSENR